MRPVASLLVLLLLLSTACLPKGCSRQSPPARAPVLDAGEPDADAFVLPPPPPPKPPPQRAERGPAELREDFSSGALDPKRWVPFVVNDVRMAVTKVQDRGKPGKPDFRLALGADTTKTDDSTVKTIGVRTKRSFDFRTGKRFSVDLDWNDPANASYLTAAIYLCPTVAVGSPRDEPDWLRFEYIGVPTDNTVRTAIARRVEGRRRWLDRGGWPKVRTGKVVRNSRIDIIIDAADVAFLVDGQEVFRDDEHGLPFTDAVVYLLVTSHSNYFVREILFDNVEVAAAEVPK